MKQAKDVRCSLCGQAWPFAYQYCPMDGRSLSQAKKRLLNPDHYLRELSLSDQPVDLTMLNHDVFGTDSNIAITWESLIELLPQVGYPWDQMLIRRHGLDGEGQRTFAGIGAETGINAGSAKEKYHRAKLKLRNAELRRRQQKEVLT